MVFIRHVSAVIHTELPSSVKTRVVDYIYIRYYFSAKVILLFRPNARRSFFPCHEFCLHFHIGWKGIGKPLFIQTWWFFGNVFRNNRDNTKFLNHEISWGWRLWRTFHAWRRKMIPYVENNVIFVAQNSEMQSWKVQKMIIQRKPNSVSFVFVKSL